MDLTACQPTWVMLCRNELSQKADYIIVEAAGCQDYIIDSCGFQFNRNEENTEPVAKNTKCILYDPPSPR